MQIKKPEPKIKISALIEVEMRDEIQKAAKQSGVLFSDAVRHFLKLGLIKSRKDKK